MAEDHEDEDKYEEVTIETPEESGDEEGLDVEEMEVEVTEISLDEDDINYWISQLEKLRENKAGDISLPLDDESELVVNYGGDSEDDTSDGGVEFEENDDNEDDEDMEDEE